MQQLSEQHEMGVSGVSVSPDAMTLCVTSLADTASLWDFSSLEKIASLPHADSATCSLFLSDTTLLTACEDFTVLLWDSRNLAEPASVIRGFKEGVNHFLVSPDGSTLFSACDDGHVYVHSLASGTEFPLLDKLWVSSNTVNDLIFEPSSGLLLASAEDCSVKALRCGEWGALETDARIVASADSFPQPVNHIRIHNGIVYAAMSEYLFDFGFNAAAGAFADDANVFEGHEDFIRGIEIIADDVMLTVSDDSTCIEWSISRREAVKRVKMHEAQVMASTVRYVDGIPQLLVTGCEDGTVRLWPLPLADK